MQGLKKCTTTIDPQTSNKNRVPKTIEFQNVNIYLLWFIDHEFVRKRRGKIKPQKNVGLIRKWLKVFIRIHFLNSLYLYTYLVIQKIWFFFFFWNNMGYCKFEINNWRFPKQFEYSVDINVPRRMIWLKKCVWYKLLHKHTIVQCTWDVQTIKAN